MHTKGIIEQRRMKMKGEDASRISKSGKTPTKGCLRGVQACAMDGWMREGESGDSLTSGKLEKRAATQAVERLLVAIERRCFSSSRSYSTTG